MEKFESDGKFFIKSFLLDDSLNLNKWGVTRNALLANLDSFIGKPFVVTEDFGHPESSSGDQLLKDQEKYRVGNIIEVGFDSKTSTAFAVSEITNKEAVETIRNNELNFVSPSIIFGDEDVNIDPRTKEAIINRFEGAHLAAVKEPAYGIDKAQIKGKCSGDSATCKRELAMVQASKQNKYKIINIDSYSLIFDAKLDDQSVINLTESSLNPNIKQINTMTAQEEEKKKEDEKAQEEEEEKKESMEDKKHKEDSMEDEEDDKKEEANEDNLKDIKEEVESLKAELKSLKSKYKKSRLEPIASEIVSAKQKLGMIKEAQADEEFKKLLRSDEASLLELSAEYKNLVETKSQPKYTVKYASMNQNTSDKVYLDDLFKRSY